MVDVIFLLVIFLMTSANFIPKNELNIQLPKIKDSHASSSLNPMHTLWLTHDKKVYLNSHFVPWNTLKITLKNTFTDPQKTLLIKGDKTVPYEDMIKLMGIVKSAGIKRISLATEVNP